MSILSDIVSRTAKKIVQVQQQPKMPLKYSSVYGPWEPITKLELSYQQNFFNLLLTNPGEWPMDPDLGIGLRTYLFELESSPMFANLKPIISNQLRKYLPEIEIIDVVIDKNSDMIDRNKIRIVLVYSIFGSIVHTVSAVADQGLRRGVRFEDLRRDQYQPIDVLARSNHLISNELDL